MKLRKMLLVAIMALGALPLASCDDTPEGSKELTIWWPAGKELQNILNEAIDRYKVDNPEVVINVEKKAGLDIYDAYKFALNDNNSRPDIAILDHVYVQALANENQVADLSALGSDEDVKPLVPESVYQGNVYNGKNYGLPLSANTVVLMYNKDILDACGVTTIPTTFDELLAACETVQSKGYTAFAQPINQSFVAMEFASYVARLGGKLVSDDYKTCLLDSETVRKAVDSWVSLSKYASKAEYEEGKFYNGNVAFIEMGSWNVSKVSGATALFNCGFTEMVSLDENYENYSGLGLYSFVVAEKSDVKELAYDFAKFLATDTKFQLAFAQDKDLLPVTLEALEDPYYTEDETLSVFASQLTKVVSRPGTSIWPTMEKQIVNMMYSAVTAKDKKDIDAAITNAQKLCQEATDRKYK